jgi:putative nucleotidyltransferase with HDIG domain
VTNIQTGWTFPIATEAANRIDWSALAGLDWISAMDRCQQDAHHHAEGDVLTHTKLVCEALTQLPDWQSCDATTRALLLAAALLHDVAKPATTKVDSAGQISSLKHTQVGASMARQILWRNAEFSYPPFALREQIVGLVRYSGLPLWFLEKEDPVKSILRASQAVRLDWLSILAESDIRGRHCADQQELLDRVLMFREFCQEHQCFDRPRMFPSDHSRFSYFRSTSQLSEREVFDDTKSSVVIMSGLPAAGKDTWIAQNLPELPVVSLDAIRKIIKVDPEDNQAPVVAAAREQARSYLRSGQKFVWNATNVSSSLRHSLISWMAPFKPNITIVYVEPASFEVLQQRNRKRKSPVPEAVLDRLLRRLEVPTLSEAHSVITHIS